MIAPLILLRLWPFMCRAVVAAMLGWPEVRDDEDRDGVE